jgi:2'-5' RNA ligase
MPDSIRAFIAFELPQSVLSSVRSVQDRLRSFGFQIRWVPPVNIHLTLKFLGDIQTADVEKIGNAVTRSVADATPLSLFVEGVGVFPDMRRPRVLWLGISGQLDALKQLQKRLEVQLSLSGYPKERRPFRGHLTLGRIKGKIDTQKLQFAMDACKDFRSSPFVASEVCLIQSRLKPAGAEYSRLMTISMPGRT